MATPLNISTVSWSPGTLYCFDPVLAFGRCFLSPYPILISETGLLLRFEESSDSDDVSAVGRFWSTAAFGICGDEGARALSMARVLDCFDCANHIGAHRHDVCVVDGGLTLWGVGVSLVEVPVAANAVTLTTHTTIVVKGAWFERQVLMCSFWRVELRDQFSTCYFGHRVVEGCW